MSLCVVGEVGVNAVPDLGVKVAASLQSVSILEGICIGIARVSKSIAEGENETSE